MISASHNPFYDNGIKVINEKGEKLEEEVITEIEKYLDGEMESIPYAVKRAYWPYRIRDRGGRKKPLYWLSDFHCHPLLQK